MRKHNLLAGVTVAAALAAAVVAVGVTFGSVTGESGSAVDAALPLGHPPVLGKGGSAGTTATDASVQKTISRLERQRAGDPRDIPLLLRLGDAYFLGQRYRQAERTFRQVLRLDTGNPTAAVRLAMVWHAEGETARAEEAIQSVLAVQPDDQEAHYSMAILYFSTDQVEAARKQWVIAARLDPKSTIGRRSQSFVDLLGGDQGQAGSGSD